MKFQQYIFGLSIAALLFTTTSNADEKPKTASKKYTANYRQSSAKRETTVTNPYARTSTKVKEDQAATAEFKKFNAKYYKMRKDKDFDAIHAAVDALISKQKKLTPVQKSSLYWSKASAYLDAQEYDSAIKTAQQGIKVSNAGAGRNAAVIIKAAIAENNIKLADKTIQDFEKSTGSPDADYYSTVVNHCFKQNRYDDAYDFLIAFGKYQNLSAGYRAQIYKGFGRYYIQKKNYPKAIAQYNAIKVIPKIDQYSIGDADLQIAACHIKMQNKEKALEIYKSLAKSKDNRIRNAAANEIKKLTAKPAAPKKPAAKKKKPAAKKKK